MRHVRRDRQRGFGTLGEQWARGFFGLVLWLASIAMAVHGPEDLRILFIVLAALPLVVGAAIAAFIGLGLLVDKLRRGGRDKPAGATALESADVDPLDEADVYLAYGRRGQAMEILEEALRRHPGRDDIRKRLCELTAGACR